MNYAIELALPMPSQDVAQATVEGYQRLRRKSLEADLSIASSLPLAELRDGPFPDSYVALLTWTLDANSAKEALITAFDVLDQASVHEVDAILHCSVWPA